MGLNAFQFNRRQFNRGVDKGTGQITFDDPFAEPYQLELHEQGGNLVFTLPKWYGGSWTQRVNEPDSLSFTYPDDGSGRVEAFTLGREVWLYHGDTTEPVAKFLIHSRNLIETNGTVMVLNCKDILYQLSLEQVNLKEYTELTSVKEICRDLLEEFQVRDSPVYLGAIHPAIVDVQWQGKFEVNSILGCIRQMHELAGGYFWVDENKTLNWSIYRGDRSGMFDLRIERNVLSVQKTVTDSELANRIVAYGAGETADGRVTVTVDDATSQASYGIRTALFSDKRIKDVALLEEYANAELERRKEPQTTYSIVATDLSKSDSYDYSFEAGALLIGSHINVISENIDILTEVHSITKTLDRPMSIEVEVTDPTIIEYETGTAKIRRSIPESVIDSIADLHERLWRAENMDGGVYDELSNRFEDTYGTDILSDRLHDGFRDAFRQAMGAPAGYGSRSALLGGLNTRLDEADPSGEPERGGFDDNIAESILRTLDEAVLSGETLQEALERSISSSAEGDYVPLYTSSTVGGLDNDSTVEEYSMGFVSGENRWYQRNSANDGWIPINRWEDQE